MRGQRESRASDAQLSQRGAAGGRLTFQATRAAEHLHDVHHRELDPRALLRIVDLEGGGTRFPHIKNPDGTPLIVQPKRGSAVWWPHGTLTLNPKP